MRAVVQRVKESSVSVNEKIISRINRGLNILVGITLDDDDKDVKYIGDKIIGLRIFDDEKGVMNLSVQDVKGEILLISQFTLYGDARKGRRPSYINALNPKDAENIYKKLVEYIESKGFIVKTGEFGGDMDVSIINDGPVTILLDSKKEF